MPDETTQSTRRDAAEAPQKKGRTKRDLPIVEGALLDTRYSAAKLGLGIRAFQEAVANREIACIKIGRAVRFHPDDLEAFIDAKRIKAIGWKGNAKREAVS